MTTLLAAAATAMFVAGVAGFLLGRDAASRYAAVGAIFAAAVVSAVAFSRHWAVAATSAGPRGEALALFVLAVGAVHAALALALGSAHGETARDAVREAVGRDERASTGERHADGGLR